jgi:lipoic acid synthetase
LSRELRVISNPPSARPPRGPKPDWLRVRIGDPTNQNAVLRLIEGLNLHTVCQEARCPNIFECWADRTATFMIGGDTCTRHCGFCAVGKGRPGSLDPEEPRHVAEAVSHLGLAHTVITSVNRDDLADGGAAHWAETVRQVRALNPGCRIEVLIPDFNGDEDALNTVLDARPDVLNHNTETIARLYRRVRPDARYEQSLTLLARAAARLALERCDSFFAGLVEHMPDDMLLVVASDHGNIEDGRVGHTRNPAIGLMVGAGHAAFAGRVSALTDVTPAIVEVLEQR